MPRLFWAPPPLYRSQGRDFFSVLSRKRMRRCCSYVCWWVCGTIAQKPFRHIAIIFTIQVLREPFALRNTLKYAMHALCLVHFKAQIVYLCCTTKTRPEHVSVIQWTYSWWHLCEKSRIPKVHLLKWQGYFSMLWCGDC